MADYGNMRHHLLLGSTLVGAAACCLVALVGSSYTVFAMNFNVLMFIVANVAFGFAFIVYNSYLPVLSDAHPDVIRQQGALEDQEKVREAAESQLSGNGIKVGMLGQMVFLALSAVAGMSLPNMIAFGGLWSGGIGIFSVWQLLARPGRPLPPNAGYVGTSIRQVSSTISQLKKLSQLSLFLFAYFIFAGACSTVATQATTLASKTMVISNATIICLIIVISLTAIVGCILAFKCNATPKMLLIGCLFLQSSLPLYALKVDQVWQLFMIGILFGLSTGPQQAFTRSIFSSTVPKGHQAEFFGFYGVTDKGTAFACPMVLTIVTTLTGDFRFGFACLCVFFALGISVLAFFKPEVATQQRMKFEANEREVSQGPYLVVV
jgi:UMF1 family MFS transporter